MKFVIDRKTWYRGQSEGSALLREDGMRCCIGQICKSVGIPDHLILRANSIMTADLPELELQKLPKWIQQDMQYHIETRAAEWRDIRSAYLVNDVSDISDTGVDREAKLQEIARANGDEIEFIN